jgi:hypothetical protein
VSRRELPEVDDPAEAFARSFRLTGRMFRRRAEQSRVLLNVGLGPILSDQRSGAAGAGRHQDR